MSDSGRLMHDEWCKHQKEADQCLTCAHVRVAELEAEVKALKAELEIANAKYEGERKSACELRYNYAMMRKYYDEWVPKLKLNINGMTNALKRERRITAGLREGNKALKAERAQAVARIEALRPSRLERKADPRKDAFDDAIDASLKALKGDKA